ncbi:sensor histidine kinase [Streptomyces sp. AM 2-1-1]|uniref:sensor histidine kinase n=1 Tax=Streptomyces sp. AM 2-1-1 TaxID=3028709 RepID=UPI0023B9FBE9|nr:sensor histidine kinase [Streptomyces sp. AM 2-1-1]WEH41373.1 sensor domain-containing protein [Streptomyces sp. AM 2-1-1]
MATAYGSDARDQAGGRSGSWGGPGEKHFFPAVLRAPVEARTWRELLHLVVSLPVSAVLFTVVITTVSLGIGLMVTFLGIPVLAAGLAVCRGFGVLERRRARALLGLDVADPEPVRGRTGGVFSWAGAALRNGASWRHLLYGFLHFPWAVFAFTVAVTLWTTAWTMFTYPLWAWVFPTYVGVDGLQMYGDATHRVYLDSPFELTATSGIGLLLVLASPWVVRGLASVDRVMVAGLLGPSRLASRVVELESDRGVVVDTAAADLRRIERELHDGAQARLAALAMELGLAKERLAEDPEGAARLIDGAHGEVKVALRELRDLAREIHPAVLTDRGLDAALSSVASRCAVPVSVDVELPHRPARAIENLAYVTVSELLRNVTRHARATRASVTVRQVADRDGRQSGKGRPDRPDQLVIRVDDDGRGGADVTMGGGLSGLTERLRAMDGGLTVDSPAGGPTTVTARLPWRE